MKVEELTQKTGVDYNEQGTENGAGSPTALHGKNYMIIFDLQQFSFTNTTEHWY